MNLELFEQLKERYYNFFTTYDQSDAIIRKHLHCLQVAEISKQISQFVFPNKSQQYIVEIAGLYHDIGRFEQYKKYQTFIDSNSENHAHLGIQLINDHNLFAGVDNKEIELIHTIIENHNKRTIPETIDSYAIAFCNIIRDADKIDILKTLSEHYQSGNSNPILTLELPETNAYNTAIISSIMNAHIANYDDMKSLNDFKLLKLSWAFDINFAISHALIHQAKYMHKIYDSLSLKTPDTDLAFHLIDGISEAHLH